jgi:carboxylesterase
MSSPDDPELLPGATPWSHDGGPVGALCVHGFTGNPTSMRGVAEAFAAAGFSVELPRLPGHGTTVEEMMTTSWADWSGEAEAAYQRLAARTEKVVVAGLSMGGTLTLWLGLQHSEIAGLVCINPLTVPQSAEVVDMARGMLAEGTDVLPGIGSDIADPDVTESAYAGTPLRPLISLVDDGVAPITDRFGELHCPLIVLSSPQDHVVEPSNADHLATTYGGPVERVTLERSYHVATLDYDKQLIFDKAVEFAEKVTGA